MERLEINCETGEEQIIPLTDEEIAAREAEESAAIEAQAAEAQAKADKAAARLSVLQKLGLTTEQAAILGI